MGILGSLLPITAFLICFGAGIAGFSYLPRIRRFASQSAGNRYLTIGTLGVSAFLLCILAFTFVDAAITARISASHPDASHILTNSPHTDGQLISELWLRKLLPPAMRASCYSGDSALCASVNAIEASIPMSTQNEYLILLAHGLVASISAIVTTAYLTRSSETRKFVIG